MAFDVNTPEEIGKLLDAYGAAVDKNAFISDLEKEVGIMDKSIDTPAPTPAPEKNQDEKEEKQKECPEGKVWDKEKEECVDKPEEKEKPKEEKQATAGSTVVIQVPDPEVEKLRASVAAFKSELIDEINKLTGLCPEKLGKWDVDALVQLRKIVKSARNEKTVKQVDGSRRTPKAGLEDSDKPKTFTDLRYPGLRAVVK